MVGNNNVSGTGHSVGNASDLGYVPVLQNFVYVWNCTEGPLSITNPPNSPAQSVSASYITSPPATILANPNQTHCLNRRTPPDASWNNRWKAALNEYDVLLDGRLTVNQV
ncbi:hypothetical protein GCM10022295_91180 [Streptomyces osmaniensis]|uniref:Uncharacterized protein n=1 Tax=Streptomyces osmaniensis TaxID=593134 RepID=A0ABP6Z4J1_9ACTN